MLDESCLHPVTTTTRSLGKVTVNDASRSELIDELYMTAREAAAELGVTINTLYSYVSRKRLRTRQVPGTRQRIYWRADIAHAKALLWKRAELNGRPDNTDITLLTPQAPFYRGRNAIDLSDHMTLEEVAALLWQVDEQQAFGAATPSVPVELSGMGNLLSHAMTTDKAIALLPFLEHANPRAFDLSHIGMCRTGADVLRWYAAILTDTDRPSNEPLHEQVAKHLKASAEVADAIRRLLVLSADHGFGAGTYAVRAVASSGVTAYRSVLAGLSIASGRESRLGRSEGIRQFLHEVADSADPRSVVVRRLRKGELIPGFDSPQPYEGQDPRAEAMLRHLEKIFGSHSLFKKVERSCKIVGETLDLYPSFALVNILFGQLVGLDRHRVLYVLGRCAGWVAHSIEQSQSGDFVAPSATYRGELPVPTGN
ncbi:regulatory protein MerR [Beijerinckia indica subsp. indica ATCC 9039]|uniref:citrate synthase (unknown stereospecificity) n=1 Tax=Beijerinckia indica subsp. indica (strain ATCC 9039 / DSM 1715 / NCIMB 8712) TaxID=395963 RepID=B2IIW4_BEII9|nr:regulatory protein MerR [Beijerinckia indica subsp. indica ATCC 9039]